MLCLMGDVLKLIWWGVTGLLRSRASLEAEIVALRHQLNVLFAANYPSILPRALIARKSLWACLFPCKWYPAGIPC